MAKGNAEQSNEVLAPGNFLSFTGAALKLFKPVGGRITLAFFALIALLFALALGVGFLTTESDSRAADAIYLAQLLALPVFVSLMSSRVAAVMVAAASGRSLSIRAAGRSMRQSRSHLIAAAALSAFLCLALYFAMGPLGNLLAIHLFLGPPLLVHAIVLEDLSFTDAWARTKEIARGEALRTFLYLLCLGLALVLVEQVVAVSSATLVGSATSSDTAVITYLLLSGLVLGGGMSLMSAFALESYVDLRARDDEDFSLDDLGAELEEDEDEYVEEDELEAEE